MGRCRTFDSGADGYGRGEGFVVMVLAPHPQQHGRTAPDQAALALVAGTAVNQDGRSSGLTAPNGPSQSRLVANALAAGDQDASLVGLIAVHGTGRAACDMVNSNLLIVHPLFGLSLPVPGCRDHTCNCLYRHASWRSH